MITTGARAAIKREPGKGGRTKRGPREDVDGRTAGEAALKRAEAAGGRAHNAAGMPVARPRQPLKQAARPATRRQIQLRLPQSPSGSQIAAGDKLGDARSARGIFWQASQHFAAWPTSVDIMTSRAAARRALDPDPPRSPLSRPSRLHCALHNARDPPAWTSSSTSTICPRCVPLLLSHDGSDLPELH